MNSWIFEYVKNHVLGVTVKTKSSLLEIHTEIFKAKYNVWDLFQNKAEKGK